MVILLISSFNTNALSINDEIHCLALNIYHEARNKSELNQVAVAMVTMERLKDSRFKNTVCGVVKDGYVVGRKDCHFSWYCDGKSDTPYNKHVYIKMLTIAQMVYYNYESMTHPMKGANHYHTDAVDPYWNDDMQFLGLIDNHLFWEWK